MCMSVSAQAEAREGLPCPAGPLSSCLCPWGNSHVCVCSGDLNSGVDMPGQQVFLLSGKSIQSLSCLGGGQGLTL